MYNPSNIDETYAPINVLTGYQQNTFGTGATLKQANVFADYKNQLKLELSRETQLGFGANNSLAEVEAAMAKRPHFVALFGQAKRR